MEDEGDDQGNPTLKAMFTRPAPEIPPELAKSTEGKELLKKIDAYKFEYGNKSMYTHEFLAETWRENPTPIVIALKGYVENDYNYPKDVQRLREIAPRLSRKCGRCSRRLVPQTDRETLKKSLDLALKMTPLTPDHHFYIDQGTFARARLVLMAIGRKLAKAGVIDKADDIMYLTYDETRKLSANFKYIDAKSIIKERRAVREDAFQRQARLWVGTIDHWSLYEEPYKRGLWGWPGVYLKQAERAKLPKGTLTGLGVSERRGRGDGSYRDFTCTVRRSEEGRDPRLHHDQSRLGRAVHEDRRPGHRFRRRTVASCRGLA